MRMYIFVTHSDAPPPAGRPRNIHRIPPPPPPPPLAAFVRHRSNGRVYVIDIGSSTLIDGATCQCNKPTRLAGGATLRFGGGEAQEYEVRGVEEAAAKVDGGGVAVAGDKENVAPQGVAAKKTQQQQQQQPCKSYTTNPSSFHLQRERDAHAHSLKALLPPPCHRDARAARKLQLPKSMMAVLQVVNLGLLLVCCFE
jgi:hypothetical protein